LEFKLRDNEENEIEYNPIKCHVKPAVLDNYSVKYFYEREIIDFLVFTR